MCYLCVYTLVMHAQQIQKACNIKIQLLTYLQNCHSLKFKLKKAQLKNDYEELFELYYVYQ